MKVFAKELQVGDKLLSGDVKDVVHLEGPPVQYEEFSGDGQLVTLGQRPAYNVVLLKLEALRDTLVLGESYLIPTIENDWMHGDTEIEVEREDHR